MTEEEGRILTSLPSRGAIPRARGSGLGARLLRATGASIAMAGGTKILNLATSVTLARLLAPAGYGAYALATSIAGLVGVPAALGMGPLLVREVAALGTKNRWDLVKGLLRRATQISGLTSAAGMLFLLALAYCWPGGGEAGWPVTLVWAGAGMVAGILLGLPCSFLMGRGRVLVGQVPGALGRPALLLTGLWLVWYASDASLTPARALAVAVAAALPLLGFAWPVALRAIPGDARTCHPTFETRRWLASALPFTLAGGLWLVQGQTDIVMLGLLRDEPTVGGYRVAVSGALLLPLLLGAVNSVIGPTLSKLHAGGDRVRLIRLVRLTALIGSLGGAGMLVVLGFWGKGMIRVAFGAEYVVAFVPMMILSAGQLANAGAGPVGLLLNMTAYERDVTVVLAVSAAINASLNLALIPLWGANGAAGATAASTAAWNLLLVWRVRRRLGFLAIGRPHQPGPRGGGR